MAGGAGTAGGGGAAGAKATGGVGGSQGGAAGSTGGAAGSKGLGGTAGAAGNAGGTGGSAGAVAGNAGSAGSAGSGSGAAGSGGGTAGTTGGTAGAAGGGSCDSVCDASEVCVQGICRGPISRWPTLGGDVHHSGFNANETGTPPLTPAWTASLTTGGGLWPAVTDGTRVYVSENGYFDSATGMWALDPANGHTLWQYNFGRVSDLGMPTVDRGSVYVAQVNNTPGTYMYGFVASTGKPLWSLPFSDQWDHIWAPLVTPAGDLYFEGGEYGGLFGLRASDGTQLFFNGGFPQWDSWSPMFLDGQLYTYVAGYLETNDLLTNAVLQTVSVQIPYKGQVYSMNAAPVSDGEKILSRGAAFAGGLPARQDDAGVDRQRRLHRHAGRRQRRRLHGFGRSVARERRRHREHPLDLRGRQRAVVPAGGGGELRLRRQLGPRLRVRHRGPADGLEHVAGRMDLDRGRAGLRGAGERHAGRLRAHPGNSMRSIGTRPRGAWPFIGCSLVLWAACSSSPSGTGGTAGTSATGGHAGMSPGGAVGNGGGAGGAVGGSSGGASGSSAGTGGQGGGAAGAAGAAGGGAAGAAGSAGAAGAATGGAAGGRGGAAGAGAVGGVAGSGGAGGSGAIGGGAGSGAIGGGGGAAQTCVGVCGKTLALQSSHMVYDSSRDCLYVTIQGAASLYPNTVTTIDPRAAVVTASLPIGSDPNVLALSNDASTLWVGMDGSFSMRKVTLSGATPVVGPLHRVVGSTTNGTTSVAVYVQAMLPMSDSPDTVAALASGGPNTLAVYDDGVPRANPNKVTSYPTAIFNGPPGSFYGLGSGGLYWMRELSTGIAQATFPNLLGNQGAGTIYKANRLYITGTAFDVSTPSTPTAVGTLPFSGTLFDHTSPNRLCLLSQTSAAYVLQLINTETLTQQGTAVNIPSNLVSTSDWVTDIAYLGGDEVALLAGPVLKPARVVLLHVPMLANDGVDPSTGAGGQGGSATGTGGITGTGGSAGTGGTGGLCAGCTLHGLDVPGFHMRYDQSRARLYSVLTYSATHDPNTLFSIDVPSETVLAKVPIPSSPRQMALAEDGTTLWLGFDSSSKISKLDLTSTPPVSVAADTLPSVGGLGLLDDLAPLPGTATSIAANIGGTVAILDDGVARPTIASANNTVSISELVAGPAGALFGYDAESSAGTFASFAISTSGVTRLSAQQGLANTFSAGIHYYLGRVYVDSGEVIDVSDPTSPVRAGKFDFSGLVTPLSPTRMLMLTSGATIDYLQIVILDSTTFAPVASLSFDSGIDGGTVNGYSDLVYLGDDGVAFLGPSNLGNSGQLLYIFRSPVIAAPP